MGVRLRICPAWLLAAAAAIPCAAFTAFHYAANVQVVAAHRVPYLSPRVEIEELLEAGSFLKVKAGDVLATDMLFPWECGSSALNFYCLHTQTRLGAVLLPADAEALGRLVFMGRVDDAAPHPLRLRFVQPGQPGGYAIAGRLRVGRTGSDGRLVESGVEGMRLAVWRGAPDDPRRDSPFILHSCCWHAGGDPHRVDPVNLSSTQLRRLRTTDHWTLYEVESPYPYLDSEAAWIEFTPPALDHLPSN